MPSPWLRHIGKPITRAVHRLGKSFPSIWAKWPAAALMVVVVAAVVAAAAAVAALASVVRPELAVLAGAAAGGLAGRRLRK